MKERTREEILMDRDYTLFGDRNSTKPVDVSKLVMPVTLALSVGWIVASFVYGAGNKVGASEKDITYLVSKCDQLEKAIKDSDSTSKALIRNDDESITELKVRMQALRDYLAQVEFRTGGSKAPFNDSENWNK